MFLLLPVSTLGLAVSCCVDPVHRDEANGCHWHDCIRLPKGQMLDWSARVDARQAQARGVPKEVGMDPDFLRLTEKAWDLRQSGDSCINRDVPQAVRYYEWAQVNTIPNCKFVIGC
eukprot:s980_g23.t1